MRELIHNSALGINPVGFIDDNLRYQGKQINGFPVLGTLDILDSILGKNSISEVILCQENLPQEKLHRLTEICSAYQILRRRLQTRLEEIPINE